ncbi:hypothetical protein [Halococcus sp. AFM35]|uniref:hypothetical protein n=1 Tax=Halococcus sp. AFM35 TaxID=3421653 RepID=UPI003EB7FCEF
MPVPGYDPEDLDEELEATASDGELRARMTDEEFREYENGAHLIELLDEEDIDDLLHGE